MSKELEALKIVKYNSSKEVVEAFDVIEKGLQRLEAIEKENEQLKEIIKSLFDEGCPLHQYIDDKFGLTIEVDDECSIMQLGEFKGVDLNKKLKEILKESK